MADEEFADASDTVISDNVTVEGIKVANLAQELFFQNKYAEAWEMVRPHSTKSKGCTANCLSR